ncbi:MAG: hypothetical protein Q9184_005244 [Pyrenodesmia sp. 2 TL-2023]
MPLETPVLIAFFNTKIPAIPMRPRLLLQSQRRRYRRDFDTEVYFFCSSNIELLPFFTVTGFVGSSLIAQYSRLG